MSMLSVTVVFNILLENVFVIGACCKIYRAGSTVCRLIKFVITRHRVMVGLPGHIIGYSGYSGIL